MLVKFTLDPTNLPSPMSSEELQLINELAEHQTYADSPELDDAFFTTAQRVANTPVVSKRRVTAYLDEDVLAWLKKAGPRYQTRMNRILRRAMESDQPQG